MHFKFFSYAKRHKCYYILKLLHIHRPDENMSFNYKQIIINKFFHYSSRIDKKNSEWNIFKISKHIYQWCLIFFEKLWIFKSSKEVSFLKAWTLIYFLIFQPWKKLFLFITANEMDFLLQKCGRILKLYSVIMSKQ